MWGRCASDGVARKPSLFTEQNVSTPTVFEPFSKSSRSTGTPGLLGPSCNPQMAFLVLVIVIHDNKLYTLLLRVKRPRCVTRLVYCLTKLITELTYVQLPL